MKAGILDLSFSIPILLFVILLTSIAFNLCFRPNRNVGILNEEGEAVDRFQFLLERFGYVDPCSGNIYPIFTSSLSYENTLPIHINTWDDDAENFLYLFPVLIFSDGKFGLAFLGVREENACLLVCH